MGLRIAAWLAAAAAGLVAQEPGGSALWDVMRRRYDKDGDGKVTAVEYGRDAARFGRFDRNGDGVLSADDFGRERLAESGPSVGERGGQAEPAASRPAAGEKDFGLGAAASAERQDEDAFTQDQVAFFEKKIRPVLATHCYECHSARGAAKAGLRLDDRDAILKGGASGPALVPGDADGSLLVRAVRYVDEELEMPPKGKLPAATIKDFEAWVAMGAPFPGPAKRADGGNAPGGGRAENGGAGFAFDFAKEREFWAFREPLKQPPPMLNDETWAWTEVDRFLLGEMEAAGLKPVGDADRRTWLRRVTFDLVGLPPTPAEIEAFEKDDSPDAHAKVVDRLLASPQYGERWGRHWLDVARYAESSGKEANILYPHAWRYRDYVIDAYAADVPYDRFVKEQLAGDLMKASDPADRARKLTATGFLAVGPKGHNTRGRAQFEMDVVDEQIDAVTQAFLGMTAACARCHDHKFDPIPQRDYYALAGIFLSSETCYGTQRTQGNNFPSPLVALPPEAAPTAGAVLSAAQRRTMNALRARLEGAASGETARRRRDDGAPGASADGATARAMPSPQDRQRMRVASQQLAVIDGVFERFDGEGHPTEKNLVAMGMRDDRRPRDARFLERGEIEQPQASVPRGFLQILDVPQTPARIRRGSGRLELAEWIASPANPLTARVYVNRVWGKLFGRPLVVTADNFGRSGRPPSHPALLDALAVAFVEDGWSTKTLIRKLVLTHAYRLSSDRHDGNLKRDPDGILLWRMPKKRLEGEAIRDAMLAAAGMLDLARPAGSPVNTKMA